MRFKPLGPRVLLRPVERKEATASGIVLPDTAKREHQYAEVVAAGAHEDVKVNVSERWWCTASTREPRSRWRGTITWW